MEDYPAWATTATAVALITQLCSINGLFGYKSSVGLLNKVQESAELHIRGCGMSTYDYCLSHFYGLQGEAWHPLA